jgi:BirA family transcriptional regulator, biotin operon repressor / biotin---[acetyl-CoA-carboxylase] ligase
MALFIGQEIKMLEKTDSTNRFALDLIRQSPPSEGYVVWALEQQAGKGQRGKQWLSEPGANLTFSIILQPHFLHATKQFSLTKAIALGIAQFVSHVLSKSHDVKIKWPNDIYVHDSKIAGILIENVLEQTLIKHSVVGIGLNVNQVVFDSSLLNPASLKLLTSNSYILDDCLKRLCSFIEKYYLVLRAGYHKQLDDEYHELLYKRGVWSNFMLNNERFMGKIEGVNKQGHLLMQKKSGEEIEVTDVKGLVFLN